jgi:tetratricopeptide (TPR) repeat protein
MRAGPPPRALALACAAWSACAAVRDPAAAGRVERPGEPAEASRADLDLAGRNEEELLAIGRASSQAGDHRRAAAAFGRAADLFPASRRRAEALLGAGLALQELGEWREALGRFLPLVREGSGPGADRAAFEAAACHHRLGELAQARAVLGGLAARVDLAPRSRPRALAERGVVELEMGDLGAAEQSLEQALSAWSRASAQERMDDEIPAKAHFWLGEVYRARFARAPLDLSAGEEALAQALEEKSGLLLAAQGQYFQAARRGSPEFGVAGVARVGELYEALHAEMASAPAPSGLAEEEAAAWRAELSRQLRVLAQKALEAYEGALTAARARGVDNRFVDGAEEALERVKRLLLAPDAPR